MSLALITKTYHANFGVNRMNINGARAASVFHPKSSFVFECHLWLRPFIMIITAENGCSTMYYNVTVVD